MTPRQFLRRLEGFNVQQEVNKSVDANIGQFANANIAQLMQGKNRLGELMSPRITEDPYFKSRAQAEAYANWKKRMYPNTPWDRPNLRINGYLHSTITAVRVGNAVRMEAMAGFTPGIDAKYNNTAFGVSPQNKDVIRRALLLPDVRRAIAVKTGLSKTSGLGDISTWVTLVDK